MFNKTLIVFLLFLSSAVYCQQSNRAILSTLIDSILSRHSNNGKTLVLFTASGNMNELRTIAEEKSAAKDPVGNGTSVSVVLLGTGIEYAPLSSGWFSDETYSRTVTLEYAYTQNGLLQPSLVAAKDTIVSSAISSLEGSDNLYKGKFTGNAGISGFTEPVLMTILTGGVVYLFYSVRGK